MSAVPDAPPQELKATRYLIERERGTTATLGKVVAAVLVLGLGAQIPVEVLAVPLGMKTSAILGLRLSVFVALASAPLWLPVATRHRAYRAVLAVVLLCVPVGYLLAVTSSSDHAVADKAGLIATAELVAMGATAGGVLWARSLLGTRAVLVLYGASDLVSRVPLLGTTGNDWKFVISGPLSLVVLGLVCTRPRRPFLEVGALLALAATSALNDSRSHMGFCVIVLGLVAWQNISPRLEGGLGKFTQGLALASMGVGAYVLGASALTSGRLGAQIQARTLAQIENSGSLIGGGRPEWFATFQLMAAQPWGFGVGVLPNTRDIVLGTHGLQEAKVYGARDYAANYLFAGQFRLHSITADLWSRWGVVGILLAILIVAIVVNAALSLLQARAADSALLFLTLSALWNMGFSPIYSDLPQIALALGLLIPFVGTVRRTAATEPPRGTGLLQPPVCADVRRPGGRRFAARGSRPPVRSGADRPE